MPAETPATALPPPRVLFVHSCSKHGDFEDAQAQSLRDLGLSVERFCVPGGGVTGYARTFWRLRRRLHRGDIDLVHAHYGLSGLMACLQRRVPVVVSFIGSDVNVPWLRRISRVATKLAAASIVVEESMLAKLRLPDSTPVLPYGIDWEELEPQDKLACREALGLPTDRPVVLFASRASRPEKNYPLADAAVSKIPGAQLLELGGYERPEYVALLSAVDMLLMTSVREGSPVVIVEALAANCPIVATDVGDVRRRLDGVTRCFVTSFDAEEIATAIEECLSDGRRSDGRERVANQDLKTVASEVVAVYEGVLRRDGSAKTLES